MSDTRKVRLWLIRETPDARLYSKLPPDRHAGPADTVWIPRSVIEHTTKMGIEHYLTLPEWICDERGL